MAVGRGVVIINRRRRQRQQLCNLSSREPMVVYDLQIYSMGGKRVLLSAKSVYTNGRVPKDEYGYLFQYHVEKVNEGQGNFGGCW